LRSSSSSRDEGNVESRRRTTSTASRTTESLADDWAPFRVGSGAQLPLL
jgi:hypothetical protein